MTNIRLIAVSLLFLMLFPFSAKPIGKKKEAPLYRFEYGISLGGYFANRNTASYYDGSGDEVTDNSISRVLLLDYNYQRLRNVLGTDFILYELPGAMRYNPAFKVGFFGTVNITNKTGIIAECNYAKLKVEDGFTIKLDQYSGTSEPVLKVGSIRGTEERIDIRLGITHVFRKKDAYINPFIEIGGNLVDTKVVNNKINVEGIEMSILSTSNQYYQVEDYGIGYGGYVTAGLVFDVSESFAFRLGGSANVCKINLGENKDMKPQYSVFIRIMLNPVVS